MRLIIAIVLALAFVAVAQAETPAFDPRSWRGQHEGPPTEVLTLGSAHLSQLPKPATSEMLAPLLDKLAAFKPDIITHEGISGEQCDILKRYSARYPGMFHNYCYDASAAEKATGLDVPAAMAAIDKEMANWSTTPTAAQRRRLAALFLAANDRPSALVQWGQLLPTERKIGDGVDEPLLEILRQAGAKPNETIAIAVALAVRLKLSRVYSVDDHTADSIQSSAGPSLEKFLQKHWNGPPSAIVQDYQKRVNEFASPEDLLALYRFMNRPETQRAFVTLDYKGAMTSPSSENLGRIYVAWWEVRNLRMVANIRAAFGTTPGARVLNIVGASHKPYYDAYLDMMSDIKLVDIEEVLR